MGPHEEKLSGRTLFQVEGGDYQVLSVSLLPGEELLLEPKCFFAGDDGITTSCHWGGCGKVS